jgi:hypothetical protein
MLDFGKRLRRYRKSVGRCNGLKKRICQSNPNCTYTKKGCRGRSGTVRKGVIYEGPSLAFGKRVRRYRNSVGRCNGLKKRICQSNPNCTYTKKGCRGRSGTVKKGVVYEGPSLAFGKRVRRYRNSVARCNGLRKRICQSNPNCTYTKRGCRGRLGTVKKGVVYEGPSLQFGKRVRRYRNSVGRCNGLKKRICQSNPNCTYTKRGCRGRAGTVKKGVVYEGPSLEFGKSGRGRGKKPSKSLVRLAKKYKVRLTVRKGSRKVYKSLKNLKKEIKRKILKRKSRHVKRSSKRTNSHNRNRFGETLQKQTGVYSDFFGSKIPRVIGPEWNCNKQPDGSCHMIGSPFYKY